MSAYIYIYDNLCTFRKISTKDESSPPLACSQPSVIHPQKIIATQPMTGVQTSFLFSLCLQHAGLARRTTGSQWRETWNNTSFLFQRLFYRWGEVYHPPKKIHPPFFWYAQTRPYNVRSLRLHHPEDRSTVAWHVHLPLRREFVPGTLGWRFCFFRPQKKGKAHRKTLRCKLHHPLEGKTLFFSKRESMVILLMHSYIGF